MYCQISNVNISKCQPVVSVISDPFNLLFVKPHFCTLLSFTMFCIILYIKISRQHGNFSGLKPSRNITSGNISPNTPRSGSLNDKYTARYFPYLPTYFLHSPMLSALLLDTPLFQPQGTILDRSCCNTNPLPPNSVLPCEISIFTI